MKFDERHLVQLAAVVEAGGVTEGAALLGTSQPAISRTLSIIEKRAGQPLFIAGRRPLQPTALGRQLAIHGKTILAASRKASETVASFRGGTSGRVRVGGVPFFMDAIISGVIASFQMQQPDIHFDQSYGHYNELVNSLLANEIDVAITPAGTQDISAELVFEPLISARNIVACNAAHPLLMKKKLTKADFVSCSWVAPLPGSPLMLDLTNILMTLGIGELAIRYAGGSLHSVVNYLAATQALAIMPLSVIHSLQQEMRITILPLNIPQPERMIGIVYRRQSDTDPVNRKFFTHLRANLINLARVVAKRDASIPWEYGPFMHVHYPDVYPPSA
jgi:DNA-binding transcriptional LysR family regulator